MVNCALSRSYGGPIFKQIKQHSFLLYCLRILLISGAYYITARMGMMMGTMSGFATLIWPPSGIALAALILWGRNLWPAVFIGGMSSNYFTGAPLLTSLGVGAGNSLAAVVAVTILIRLTDFNPAMERLRDVIWLAVIGALLSTNISSLVGVISFRSQGVITPDETYSVWQTWWLGDMLGDLVVAPLVLTWVIAWRRQKFKHCNYLESLFLFATTFGVSMAVFGGFSIFYNFPLPFILFPFIVWAAIRFGQLGTVSISFFISALAVWTTMKGYGPFLQEGTYSGLVLLHVYIGVLATTGMVLAAVTHQRNVAEAELRKAVKARDDFLSLASHELKTPVTSLKLQLHMAKRNVKPDIPLEKLNKSLDSSARQVDRITTLIEDLLDISRIQAGRMAFNFQLMNLSDLVKEVVENFQDQLTAAKCPVNLDIHDDVWGYWDHERLEQVVINLLSNALKYAPGKPIFIKVVRDVFEARIIIQDQGPGIQKDKQATVFERFERGSAARSVGGLGLGLFITKNIVEAHRGKIRLDSDEGIGATFTVAIPISLQNGQSASSTAPTST